MIHLNVKLNLVRTFIIWMRYDVEKVKIRRALLSGKVMRIFAFETSRSPNLEVMTSSFSGRRLGGC